MYVTGWSDGPSGVYDYVTLKYNVSDSNPVWGASFNSPYNMVDFAYGIAVDPPGNIYVTGESYKYEQIGSGYKYSSDCVTIKYTPGSDTLWLRRFNGWADSNDAGLDIAADTRGNVYVTGKSFGSNFDYATIKYSTSTGIKDEAELGNKPSRFMLSQNYPNPFNPFTTIEYYLPKPAQVSLCIYNILGQKVKILLDEYQSPGIRRTIWDGKDERGNSVTSGIYFYKLNASDFAETRKMLLLK